MKKLRISNSSFEKSLNTFVSKRIFGHGETGENIRSEKGFPVCYHKVRMNDNTELTQMCMWYENTDIRVAAQKLLNAYKAKPNWNKSGFEIKSRDNWTTQSEVKMTQVGPDIDYKMVTVPSPISRFYLTYTFEGDYLYFKFFARFKNGHKNRKIKQMKIKWFHEKHISEPIVENLLEPKGAIAYCYLLLSQKITRDIVGEIMLKLRKIDYTKTTEEDMNQIIAICSGLEKDYTDDVTSYVIFLLDSSDKSTTKSVKYIVNKLNSDTINPLRKYHD